ARAGERRRVGVLACVSPPAQLLRSLLPVASHVRNVACAPARLAVFGEIAARMRTSLGVANRCRPGRVAVGAGLHRARLAFHVSGRARLLELCPSITRGPRSRSTAYSPKVTDAMPVQSSAPHSQRKSSVSPSPAAQSKAAIRSFTSRAITQRSMTACGSNRCVTRKILPGLDRAFQPLARVESFAICESHRLKLPRVVLRRVREEHR